MRLDVLGPLRLRADDGRDVPVPAGRPTTALTLLAVRRGQSVDPDLLLDALSGGEPTPDGELDGWVDDLRTALASATASGADRLRWGPAGYQLRLHTEECDLFEFEELVLAGRAAAGAGYGNKAASALRAALDLWRGNPFAAGVTSGSAVLRAEAHLWEEMRATAHEDRIEADLGLRAGADLVAELRRLVAEQPGRERPRRLLERALDTAERPVVVSSAEPVGRSVPSQLPRGIADFTGRDSIVDRVAGQLDGASPSVVSVTGPAGAGKTTLAVRAAHVAAQGFPDGRLYVSLDGGSARPRQPEQVLAGLLRDLGVPDGAIPAGLAERTAAYRARLAGLRVLVLLDDAADVAQVEPLLPGTPGSAVLVTSRSRLTGLPVTGSTELGALTHEEALALLARVVGARRAAADPAAADDIVELCGRLPLAIRVVAARLVTRPSWTVGSLLGRLRAQRRMLDELTVEDLDVRAGFAVSYAALFPADQVVFRRFALAGVPELSAWAVRALSGRHDTDGSVARLVDSHLLERVTVGPDRRYRMHDLVRLFAAEMSAESDGEVEERSALRRLFDATRSLVGIAYEGLPVPADWLPPVGPVPVPVTGDASVSVTADPMAWCGREVQTLQAVLTRAAGVGWHRETLDAVERLAGFLAIQHRMGETERLYSALADGAGADDLVVARATYGLAEAKMMAGRLTEAAELFSRAVAGFTRLGEHVGLAHGLVFLSFCHGHRGEMDEADAFAQRGLAVARESGDRRSEIRALRQLGAIRIRQDRVEEAVELLDRALVLADEFGSADLEGIVLNSLSNALVESRDLDRADEVCRRAGALLDRLAQPVARAYIGVTQGRIAELRGRHLLAIELLEGAQRVFHQFGDRRGEAGADFRLGVNEMALGRSVRAVPLLRSAVTLFRDLELVANMELAQEALMTASRSYLAD